MLIFFFHCNPNQNRAAKLAKILEDKGVLSDFISNFASEIEPKSMAHTSEKVLFELSSFSKFLQNSLIDSKISTDNAYIGSIYLPLWVSI